METHEVPEDTKSLSVNRNTIGFRLDKMFVLTTEDESSMCDATFILLLLVLLVLLILCPEAWTYEAPEVKQDVFATTACPAFLTFTNAAYLAGVTLELPCRCKPQQVQSVVWFFRKHLGSSRETRALTDHHGNKLLDPRRVPHSADLQSRFAIRLFSLLIFRAGADDSGVYICGSAHKDFFYSYDLDIQEARTLSFTPRLAPETTSEKRKERRLGSARLLYRVFTSFRPWSVCDRCGVLGEQVRIGLCYVHSHFLHVRYRRANQTVASCGSGAVPRAFGKLKRSRVGAKLEVRSCQVVCPPPAPRASSILSLMAFLGYNSASLPVEVPVFYLSHPADRVLTLGCPGARANMAVAWDRGSEPIYRYEHATGRTLGASPPRLQIDTGHHLLFNPAKIQDSGIYYCWLQGRQAAEIRLLVYLRLGRGQSVTSHPEFQIAVKTVLTWYAVMTAVFCILVFGRAGVRHLRDTHVD
ncbi:Ig-like V-type domain-containing protein FAM187A isoform X2 [Acanthopagrus latus]|uniref:Ig-like V-type domain-containing protein FAM187A isoform X2 n=1 Tax=Acanthopagrus latus TaxID=8177 RepID=UPI00187C1DC2|nr:Ig-like V-type domain-containing protein FAM187A isoform X2 [Acanthopagrus latus]